MRRKPIEFASPLPAEQARAKVTRADWSGLNYRQKLDTGQFSHERNISTGETPYLTPSAKPAAYMGGFTNPVSLFGFGGALAAVYAPGGTAYIDYITAGGARYTGTLGAGYGAAPRSIVQFNLYDTPTDPLGGSYVRKLLIFPDKKSIDYAINGSFTPANLSAGISQVPDIEYAAVHLSRLFGAGGGRVYASAFNDYTNWALDTVLEQNEASAWVSPAQANTKADGEFTGITAFGNHIVCFKRDYTHEIYNNKNPFRIYDIFEEGTIDNRSIADVGGQLMFVSGGGVKVYTGGKPRDIGYRLGADRFTGAAAGSDGRRYYLYCITEKKAHNLFVYDTYADQWSEQEISQRVAGFAKTDTGMYMLCGDGWIYRLDTGNYSHDWSAETDLYSGGTSEIKHIQKAQILADIGAGARLEAHLLYDGEAFDANASHRICSVTNTGVTEKKTVIRAVPRQTANHSFRLRLSGFGFVRVYRLELYLKEGGELHRTIQ